MDYIKAHPLASMTGDLHLFKILVGQRLVLDLVVQVCNVCSVVLSPVDLEGLLCENSMVESSYHNPGCNIGLRFIAACCWIEGVPWRS